MKSGVGQPIPRVEDPKLVTGRGCYTDDIEPGTGLAVAFLRAPLAHARVLSIDTSAAAALAGVHLVATQADLDADGIGEIRCQAQLETESGETMTMISHPPMVRDVNRTAGDIVAVVVGDDVTTANDAIELIDVRYEGMDAVTDVYAAMQDGAPQLYDEYPNNIAFNWVAGDHGETNAAIAAASKAGLEVLDIDVVNNRVIINSMETRPMIAAPGEAEGTLDIWCGTQGPIGVAEQIAKALKMDLSQVRIRTGDVGGSFGFKIFLHPEQLVIAWAALKIGRKLRWQQARSEGFVSDLQGRDNRTKARAVIDKNGKVHALAVTLHANMGSWLSNFSTYVPTKSGSRTLTTNYDIPVASLRVLGVMTNTPAVDAYRGAGRPEANYVMERLMDHIAAHVGVDRAEIRRRNLISADQMPHTMVLGGTIDDGEMPELMEDALNRADYHSFEERRADSASRSMLRGIGFGMYLEQCGGGSDQGVDVKFREDGTILVLAAQQENGQGHRTTLTQILSDRLGFDADKIEIFQGDSAIVPKGTTGGANMTTLLGSAVAEVAARTLASARPHAAEALDCSEDDLVVIDGIFSAKNTNRSITIEDLVLRLVPSEGDHPFNIKYAYKVDGATYPYGCHVVELEVDPATCKVEIQRYTVVDDFGTVINPLMLAGQIHGGITQGIGQAIFEHAAFDEQGQLLAGSLMDYALPRADDLPNFDIHFRNIPCKNNILGVKGSGEAGAIGAPQAVISALCDALGVTHIDMPATPSAIWQVLCQKNAERAAE
ncbi:MAG: molybdopterin-dependent oxidoreductase [Bacteroidetes bacterium]|nr:molybdopterin-dependent oxidoreductase [Bacteroidota bacterium]